jgi:hypothetical protein
MSSDPTAQRRRERDILNRLWDIRIRVESDDWEIDARGDHTRLVTLRSTGEEAEICRFSQQALSDEIRLIAGLIPHLTLLLDLVERATARIRAQDAELARLRERSRPKDYAAQAAMLCQNTAFQLFLEGKGAGGSIADAQAADTRMKGLLAITSKKDINTDERAQRAFLSLRADFKTWKGGAA